MIAAICSTGYGANFTDPGTWEIGGTASFGYVSLSGYSGGIWSFAPGVNFFPSKYFMLGPTLSVSSSYGSAYNYYLALGAGFNYGLVLPIQEAKYFLYLTSGAQVINANY